MHTWTGGLYPGTCAIDFEEVDREQRDDFVALALAHLLLLERSHLPKRAEHALLPLRIWRRRGVGRRGRVIVGSRHS